MIDDANITILGKRLKEIRRDMGLSLSEVSVITGVSKTMLSQIERGESVPTISVLWRIANGLKIKFGRLITEDASEVPDIKSIEHIVPTVDDDGKIQVYCLFPFSPLNGVEVFYAVLKPGCHYFSVGHKNSSMEYFMVHKGELELTTKSCTYRLKAGNAISFDSRDKHIYVNNGAEDAQAYFVITYNN